MQTAAMEVSITSMNAGRITASATIQGLTLGLQGWWSFFSSGMSRELKHFGRLAGQRTTRCRPSSKRSKFVDVSSVPLGFRESVGGDSSYWQSEPKRRALARL